MTNPLVYGANSLDVECTCQKWDNQHRFAVASFWFNGSQMNQVQPLVGMVNFDIDFNISLTNITS